MLRDCNNVREMSRAKPFLLTVYLTSTVRQSFQEKENLPSGQIEYIRVMLIRQVFFYTDLKCYNTKLQTIIFSNYYTTVLQKMVKFPHVFLLEIFGKRTLS